jgi:hypothetical protein
VSEIPTYFAGFLEEIRLTPELRKECEDAHKELRAKLLADPILSKIIVSIFLQGSYRRHTGCRPLTDDDHVDIDVVVVTNLDPRVWTPAMVLEQLFKPFLDTHYPKQWSPNDRSIEITPDGGRATIDLVPTSAPSEIEQQIFRESDPGFQIEARGDIERQVLMPVSLREAIKKVTGTETWQREPLMIPSRDLSRWVPTHPLAQIEWTEQKSVRTNGHYVNVVKAGKWWRKRHADGKYPKHYPLEHLIGANCPDWIGSVAEGVTRTFEAVRDNYRDYALSGTVPYLRDHGVDHDVLRRVTPDQFDTFWRLMESAASQARAAMSAEGTANSAILWRDLLGPEFPQPPKEELKESVAAALRGGSAGVIGGGIVSSGGRPIVPGRSFGAAHE